MKMKNNNLPVQQTCRSHPYHPFSNPQKKERTINLKKQKKRNINDFSWMVQPSSASKETSVGFSWWHHHKKQRKKENNQLPGQMDVAPWRTEENKRKTTIYLWNGCWLNGYCCHGKNNSWLLPGGDHTSSNKEKKEQSTCGK